ncbi:heavy metal translocating P-type ATPase [Teredinibacter purpureus]|uniref:heavy metal translocating P-type ATPase n=1 Tax=Teredinibacter purpureus TaxID=2731756 RepID=UPI0005F82E2A|nr:heavy metal translocating P-type ATPase [Teredinibacter purpureus]
MTQQKTELQIGGAGCASCINKIETALLAVKGVEQAHMNFADRTVEIVGNVGSPILIKAVQAIGYDANESLNRLDGHPLNTQEKAMLTQTKRLMRNMLSALLLGFPLMIFSLAGGDMSVSSNVERALWFGVGLLTLAVMVYSGKKFYIGAWQSLMHRSTTMDTLIALGTGTAWSYSMAVILAPDFFPAQSRHVYFEACAMIIGLINLGLALEVKARGRTGDAIKRLIGLQPQQARLVTPTSEKDVPISQIKVNDLIRIRPGEKVPVDADIIDGKTTLDNAMLTGESMPVEKITGDAIFAGSFNKTGSIIAKVTQVGDNTTLAHIIALVKRAQNAKLPIGRMADVIATYFVPAVLIIALASALAWLYLGPAPSYTFAMVAATTVLIIACPCALGLATPMSVMVGVGKAAEWGVLVRNGDALQTASKITTMVLDKTGTITLGSPHVTDIISLTDHSKTNLLALAAAIEIHSEHPLGQAILDEAHSQQIHLSTASEFQYYAGLGVAANIDGKTIMLGNQSLMRNQNITTITGDTHTHIYNALAADAKTPILIAIDGQLSGIIAIADPIKTEAIAAITRLKKRGITIVMLTGDNPLTAQAIATKVGITQFVADTRPQDKAARIKALQATGEIVGMAGDGINDAPALAQADVGFAIGSGADIAIESADITLMNNSLHGLADAITISTATLNNIKQNLFGAFLYNTCGIPIAAGALYPAFGLLLSPVIAGAAMAFSSVTVVSNANRLRFLMQTKD